ncbi:MAG TPA: hypothetical protein VNO21_14970 [Polyangiaceae bacterium]|nr:hypothetical protein [Polyangiaceae bacterium]
MASMPVHPSNESAPTSARQDDVRRPSDDQVHRSHRERVRASMAWALDEYAPTLAKLAK